MEASRATQTDAAAWATSGLRQVVADYVTLTKPKVQSLLLLTTITTMYVAGDPSLALVALTCLGGSLSAGGAGAVNHWYDRDIDRQMARTASRPVAAGRISPGAALAFGIALAALAFLELSLAVNLLAACLALSGFLGYVFVYTMWLKRSTPQNIVIGGAAGALPPMVADAAVTGTLGIESLVLFAIIFLWTPPHFWALALVKSGDYARAGVPMLPNVAGPDATRRQIWLYTLVLVPVGMLPVALGFGGAAYAAVSLLSGLGMAAFAWRVYRVRTGDEAMKCAQQLFAFSILYLFLLFAVLLAESALGLRFGVPGLV